MTRLMERDAYHDRAHPPCAVGDRIRCADTMLPTPRGEIVTVSEMVWDDPTWFIHYRRDGFPSETSGGWLPHRFEKVEEESAMFTVGQRVRCIEPSSTTHPQPLIEGEIYTVTRVFGPPEGYSVDVRYPSGVIAPGWFASRFVAVEETSSMNNRAHGRPQIGARVRLTGDLERDALYSIQPGTIVTCLRHDPNSTRRWFFRHDNDDWYVERAIWELVSTPPTTNAAPLNLEEYVRKADVAKLVTRLQREKPDTDLWCDSGVWDRYVTPILGITKDMAAQKRTVTVELEVTDSFDMTPRAISDAIEEFGETIRDVRIISDTTREDA